LLEELGPADPPPGFTRQVMARIEGASSGVTGRIIEFSKGGVVMTKKAMWGLAAAATVVLVVFVVKGFPTVDRGTEATIGAAKKYQAPQIAESDVVLSDPAAQEFLQSETFDHLMKDPQARTLLSSAAMKAELRKKEFVDAIRNSAVRESLRKQELARLFDNAATRTALEDALKANASAAAVRNASASAVKGDAAQAQVIRAMSDQAMYSALSNLAIRTALANDAFRKEIARQEIADALSSMAVVRAIQSDAFSTAMFSKKIEASLGGTR